MLNLTQKNRVYVVCPANFATGGPELLHQLAFKLRAMGVEAWMYYFNTGEENPVHPNYKHYKVPFETRIPNNSDSWLVFPETQLDLLSKKEWGQCHKIVWWLSIDNYFAVLKKSQKSVLSKINTFLRGKKVTPRVPSLKKLLADQSIYHLAQCAYALDFLKKNQFKNTAYLSDFISNTFIENAGKTVLSAKKNQVLYNPKKGLDFTQKLMAAAPDISWIPLENISPQQVAKTLAQSKVYIDFGNHPGKDRFPREAALMGCCIITGRKGSAAFVEDVPIADTYKFVDEDQSIPDIIARIRACFTEFSTSIEDFSSYVAKIKTEEQTFEQDIKKVFKK
jgi:hypothetical protein